MSLMLVISATQTQTDWVSGPGTLGPVSSWGSAFYQSESINYNITGQISLVATTTPTGWQKHLIQYNGNIDGHGALFPVDFDGDGDMDLAGAIYNVGVRVYSNQMVETGTATFTEQVTLTSLAVPQCCIIWCGDLDLDGDADIVLPSISADGWYENTGSYTFTYHQIGTHSTYGYGGSCDVGDIDRDGDMDVVACGYDYSGYNPLRLWRNGGSVTFTYAQISSSGKFWRVKLGDLNNDQYLDLLNADDVRINSSGSFPATPSWTSGRPSGNVDGIWIRDFDNDGDKDLLLSDQWGQRRILWFENDGTGTSYTQHVVCPDPTGQYYGDGCVAEDIDLDGKADVVGGYSRVGFFKQITGDNFQQNIIDYISDCHWVFAANMDYKPGGNDFDLDILATYADNFVWYENTASVVFATYGVLESSIFEVTDPMAWEALLWNGNRTSSTTLSLYVRTGADATEIQANSWQGPFEVPVNTASGEFDISSVTTAGDRFFQYKVVMGGDGSESPVVYELAVRYNDHDVGATTIVLPTGTIVYNTTITPECKVYNYGSVNESYTVRMKIGDFYNRTATVTDHSPLTEITVTFPDWVATQVGTHVVSCSTELGTDLDLTNDKVTGEVTVQGGTLEPWTGNMWTPGYWKNHRAQTEALLPVSLAGGVTVTTFAEAYAILSNPSARNAWDSYLCHLLAFSLNYKNYDGDIAGLVYDDTSVTGEPQEGATLAAILALAQSYTSGTPRQDLLTLKDVLDACDNNATTGVLWTYGDGQQGRRLAQSDDKLTISAGTFSGRVEIRLPSGLTRPARVSIYNVNGTVVRTLTGTHVLSWDGTDHTGRRLSSGSYFLRLATSDQVLTRKLVIR
jgi:hypothetical protein